MTTSPARWSLAFALASCLVLPTAVVAQSEPNEDGAAVPIPSLDGLAWYRSIDQSGSEIEATGDESELAEWAVLLDDVGATFDDLEYTYQSAFDPVTLPDVGGMATVRVAGADTDALRDAVVADVITQVLKLGEEAPEPEEATIGEKPVIIVGLPAAFGHDAAIVYAHDDVAYVFLMDEDLAALALQQLP